jgi:hypothetical protein
MSEGLMKNFSTHIRFKNLWILIKNASTVSVENGRIFVKIAVKSVQLKKMKR